MVQHADINHAGLPGIGSGGAVIAVDRNAYSGGNITHNNTTLAAVSGPTDLVVAASAGDWLMVGLGVQMNGTSGGSIAFDFATMVGGSPNRYVVADSGTPINVPPYWYITSNGGDSVMGGIPYQVDAGDISGGNVTLRLYARTSSSRVVNASAAAPLLTWAVNMGQP